MPLSFPSSPTVGQTSVQNGRTYTWNGSNAWDLTGNVPGHASTHASGGSDQLSLDAAQITAGTLADARLSGNVITAATLSAMLSQSTSIVETGDRRITSTTTPLTTGMVLLSFFTPGVSVTVTQISVGGSTAASGTTLARLGLYTADSAGAVTLVARTASDTTLFNAATTLFTRSFSTTGGYPASYSLVAGTRYAAAAVIVGGNTNINASLSNATLNTLSPRILGRLDSQTDLPTSVASGGYSATGQNAIPWFRLS